MVKKLQLLLLLGVLFCFSNTTSYAYMTSDYLDYGINTLYTHTVFQNSNYSYKMKTILNSINTNSVTKSTLLSRINSQFDTWGIPNIDDVNIFGNCYHANADKLNLRIYVSNMSYPGQYTNLDFYLIQDNTLIGRYSNNSSDKFYFINITFQLDNNTAYISSFNAYENQSATAFLGNPTFSQSSDTVLISPNVFCCGVPSGFAYYPLGNSSTTIPVILQDKNGNYNPEPEPTPTPIPTPAPTPIPDGTITNNSGETTGSINLSGIEQGITGIQNTISGETNKIINNLTGTTTNIDSADKFDDMLSSTENVVDPTTNFFSWLIDNIRSVLNSTGNYDLDIPFRGETITIHSDFFVLPDGDFKTFLQLSFTAWFGWNIIKKIRYIVYAVQCVKISSALNQTDFNPNIL